MKISSNDILNFRNLIVAVCFVFCALNGAHAQTPDRDRIWTTVGSAGTVDETDTSKVFFDHGIVQMGHLLTNQPAARERALILTQTQSAVIRYNVTPVDALFTVKPQPCTGGCPALKLTLRYLAAGGRVVANLMEVDLATGAEQSRLTFTSSKFPDANGYQVRSGDFSCGPQFSFDFKRKAYYIEATLTGSKLANGKAAGIQIIKIETDICP
jgi:hypothetical protein